MVSSGVGPMVSVVVSVIAVRSSFGGGLNDDLSGVYGNKFSDDPCSDLRSRNGQDS